MHRLVFNQAVIDSPEQWDVSPGDERWVETKVKIVGVAEDLHGEGEDRYVRQTIVVHVLSAYTMGHTPDDAVMYEQWKQEQQGK